MKWFVLFFSFFPTVFAEEEPWSIHFQATSVSQYHPKTHSPYDGMYSLSAKDEWRTSLTSTLFLGRRLWKDAALYLVLPANEWVA